jgi:hypothetical protein
VISERLYTRGGASALYGLKSGTLAPEVPSKSSIFTAILLFLEPSKRIALPGVLIAKISREICG